MSLPSRIPVLLLVGLAVASCGGGNKDRLQLDRAASRVTTIGVNAYLWRASLDTLSFMPLTQADASNGVIITDWYANPAAPTERVKVTVAILDQDLRADALRISTARQIYSNGQWLDAVVRAGTVQKLEEAILAKARDLRRAAIG